MSKTVLFLCASPPGPPPTSVCIAPAMNNGKDEMPRCVQLVNFHRLEGTIHGHFSSLQNYNGSINANFRNSCHRSAVKLTALTQAVFKRDAKSTCFASLDLLAFEYLCILNGLFTSSRVCNVLPGQNICILFVPIVTWP